jgi:hypothetical protein
LSRRSKVKKNFVGTEFCGTIVTITLCEIEFSQFIKRQ